MRQKGSVIYLVGLENSWTPSMSSVRPCDHWENNISCVWSFFKLTKVFLEAFHSVVTGSYVPSNWLNNTHWIDQTDRPTSVRNRCVIGVVGVVFVFSLCFFELAVGIGALRTESDINLFLFVQILWCPFWFCNPSLFEQMSGLRPPCCGSYSTSDDVPCSLTIDRTHLFLQTGMNLMTSTKQLMTVTTIIISNQIHTIAEIRRYQWLIEMVHWTVHLWTLSGWWIEKLHDTLVGNACDPDKAEALLWFKLLKKRCGEVLLSLSLTRYRYSKINWETALIKHKDLMNM